MKITRNKLIFSGSKLTIQEFDKPVAYDFSRSKKHHKESKKPSSEKLIDPETCVRKSKKRLKDLIWSNAWQIINPKTKRSYKPEFLTLTFGPNIQDLSLANKIFKNFIKRLNYYVSKLK